MTSENITAKLKAVSSARRVYSDALERLARVSVDLAEAEDELVGAYEEETKDILPTMDQRLYGAPRSNLRDPKKTKKKTRKAPKTPRISSDPTTQDLVEDVLLEGPPEGLMSSQIVEILSKISRGGVTSALSRGHSSGRWGKTDRRYHLEN